MAKLIFLGTAGSSTVVSKQLRASGGLIFQIEDLQFHFDPGPGSLNKAREFGINPHYTTAVLVTHNHINHCNDLNVCIEAMTHAGIEHRGLVLASKSVLEPSPDEHPFLTKYHQHLLEKIIPMSAGHKVGIGLVEINALATEHTDPTAIGFKLFCPKFTVAYTGDTQLNDKLLEDLEGTDILILNVPYPENKGVGQNLDTESVMKIISHVRPKLAILTHFGLEMLKADPLVEAREVQRITGIQTIAARDGLIITPSGYEHPKSPVRGYS
ncbi:MAG: MBL fold metallo-hydrolase [Nanoarchaeota archaeon]|nr:MBL fold metallo-hydrolase [Nanoarchaeota archaeon]MBU1622788.1 MBL fold metallo-hydrolase [Nanoarchaeota archaeon]MBU1974293.1 MBL fold metallo-hydrolase [Nanoarchaeota archaeon]